jgi:hypothetical protein
MEHRRSFPNAVIPSRSAIIFRAEGRFFLSFLSFFLQLDREKESRGECEVVRVDRTEIHGGGRRGDDLPRNRSTCSWHQKPMLTTSNNSSKPSALSPASLNRKDSVYRIDRCTHASLVSTNILNMCSLPTLQLFVPL